MGLDQYAYIANKVNNETNSSTELAYWRKHPNFDDVVKLEEDIKNNKLPETTGFFFGNNSDEYYKAQDLEFVYEAKSRLFLGQKVFYNSSW